MTDSLPLVVIVGPTASGKTSLAIKLAEQLDGEIVCADSRTIYRGLDIGTAKPTLNEQARVKHWGLDLVSPDERFTVADYQIYARSKIDDIRSRGKTPFLVGGTGLYIDSVVFNYNFAVDKVINNRGNLEKMTIEELHLYCHKNNIKLPENVKNKRYVVRAIERNGINNSRSLQPISNTIIVGITTDKIILKNRIETRVEQMFNSGVVDEARALSKKYGWDSEAMKSNAYRIIKDYLDDKMSLEEAKSKIITSDWHLAKRQLTWLKRNTFIQWKERDEAEDYILNRLAKLDVA